MLKNALIISVAHGALCVALDLVALNGLSRFDSGSEPSIAESVAALLVDILIYPLYLVWTPWMSRHMPNSVEWVLFLFNSLIWGFTITLLSCFRGRCPRIHNIPTHDSII